MTELKPCGTDAAYARHLRNKEVPCKACLRAHVIESGERREATRIALQRLREAHRNEFRQYYIDTLGYTPRLGRPPLTEADS